MVGSLCDLLRDFKEDGERIFVGEINEFVSMVVGRISFSHQTEAILTKIIP